MEALIYCRYILKYHKKENIQSLVLDVDSEIQALRHSRYVGNSAEPHTLCSMAGIFLTVSEINDGFYAKVDQYHL